MKPNPIILFTIALLTVISQSAKAQAPIEKFYQAQLPIGGPNRVYIKNKYYDSLLVYLSYDKKNWYPQKLTPHSITPYRLNEQMYIRVYTNPNMYVEYILLKYKQYSVEQDNNNKWDIYLIQDSSNQ